MIRNLNGDIPATFVEGSKPDVRAKRRRKFAGGTDTLPEKTIRLDNAFSANVSVLPCNKRIVLSAVRCDNTAICPNDAGGTDDFAERTLPSGLTGSQNRRCCSATRGTQDAASQPHRSQTGGAFFCADPTGRPVEPGSNESDPADVCQWQWEDALLWTVLAELRSEVSQRNSRLLQMRLIEARSVAEVAAALSLTREQVRSRQYRMLRKLRARMAVYTGRHFGEHAVI